MCECEDGAVLGTNSDNLPTCFGMKLTSVIIPSLGLCCHIQVRSTQNKLLLLLTVYAVEMVEVVKLLNCVLRLHI